MNKTSETTSAELDAARAKLGALELGLPSEPTTKDLGTWRAARDAVDFAERMHGLALEREEAAERAAAAASRAERQAEYERLQAELSLAGRESAQAALLSDFRSAFASLTRVAVEKERERGAAQAKNARFHELRKELGYPVELGPETDERALRELVEKMHDELRPLGGNAAGDRQMLLHKLLELVLSTPFNAAVKHVQLLTLVSPAPAEVLDLGGAA